MGKGKERSHKVLGTLETTRDHRWLSSCNLTPDEDARPIALIVDDQEALRVMVGLFLRANGFRMLTAPTGRHALRICQGIKGPIEVMITDVHMPENVWI
jgi:response regulator RpfG family c-di-GMP phosphodiesterase